FDAIETRARRIVERLALALQAALLIRSGASAVADAFCAARLTGDHGLAFGTLPAGVEVGALIARAPPRAEWNAVGAARYSPSFTWTGIGPISEHRAPTNIWCFQASDRCSVFCVRCSVSCVRCSDLFQPTDSSAGGVGVKEVARWCAGWGATGGNSHA